MANQRSSGVVLAEPVVVGRVSAPYGVRGWVKVHSFTVPAENLFNYQPLFLASAGGSAPWQGMQLEQFRAHGKGFVGRFAGCGDRDAALLLAGRDLVCSATQLPVLDDGDIYWRELEGMEVLSRWQGGEALLGEVAWMTNAGASDVMVVRGSGDSIDRRERWIPWVMDQVVLHVDREHGRIEVDWDPAF